MFIFYTIFISLITTLTVFFSKKKALAYDSDFTKPQAIHTSNTPRVLGIPLFFILIFFIFVPNSIDNIYLKIFLISLLCAIFGLLEDFGFKFNPYLRFLFQLIIVSLTVLFIDLIDPLKPFEFLPSYFANNIFMTIFTIFSILTIANSLNFIDGCNGLVILYVTAISFIIYFISLDINIKTYLIFIIIYLIIILLFNFPKSFAFLGDFGAYFLGFNFSFLFIFLNNTQISFNMPVNDWFFANLFVYPSFEIFSTVLRRLRKNQSPFYPDNLHLHSLLYRIINHKASSLFANYSTSLIIFLINILIFINLFNVSIEYFYLNYFVFWIIFVFLFSIHLCL